jgi:hypothetical protein
VTLLERAQSLRAKNGGRARHGAETRFALARALRAAGRDPERARALAEEAARALRELPVGDREELPAIEAWLAESR